MVCRSEWGTLTSSVSGGVSQGRALCCNHPIGILERNLALSQVVLVCDGKAPVLASTAEDKSALPEGLIR